MASVADRLIPAALAFALLLLLLAAVAPGGDVPQVAFDAPTPDEGQVLAGAHAVSIVPDPDEDAGERWQREGCATMDSAPDELVGNALADGHTTWPSSPDCLYMGGRGLGPSEPITSVNDEHGLWVRAVALSDGTDTVVLALVDAVYYAAVYTDDYCDRCGFVDLAEDLGAELGIDPEGFLLAASHSHNAPDLLGGWGSVPGWYVDQVTGAFREAIRGAVDDLRPAVLEYDEVVERKLNFERRSLYRGITDPTFTWLRAVAPDPAGNLGPQAETIATISVYGAHPVSMGYRDGEAHPDWPGVWATRIEERFGGTAVAFVGGMGNQVVGADTDTMANTLAEHLPDVGAAPTVADPDVRAARTTWRQPLTNTPLLALATPEFFHRPVDAIPASLTVGRADDRPCRSAGAMSVETSVSAVRIGDEIAITGGPGELFSNITSVFKDRVGSSGAVTLPLSMVNDGLGYIMQSFESHPESRQGLGFAPGPFEYEEAFSIDGCFGDQVTESTLALLADLAE